MRQTMEDDVSEVLSSVVEDVGEAVNRNISGAQLLHELLSAPWLRALLKIYECLMQFQRQTPNPFLPYASGLSYEIMTIIQRNHRPSAEARELYNLLSLPHIQALLSSHDSVAQLDYLPVLPPLPDELPEDEEAMRIVCLVKNNQPLSGAVNRGSLGDEVGVARRRWSSLRRLTLERLIPSRRPCSGEELRLTESEATPLSPSRGSLPRSFLPRYQSTGSCCLCPQNAEIWCQRLNQSAPAVFKPDTCAERRNREDGASTSSDDYAYPPPPVPAYTLSLPNTPLLYKKSTTGGESGSIPTPKRAPVRVHTAPASPATQRSTQQQRVSTLPTPVRQHVCQAGHHNKRQEEPLNHPCMLHYSTVPHHIGCQNQPKPAQNVPQQQPEHPQPCPPPELNKQCSMEELRSTFQTVATSIEHSSQDVRHLGQRMMAATEIITDSVEENAQALNLLAEVVEKLQGIIVAKKHLEASHTSRPTLRNGPTPPARVSSLSPKVVRKPPTPYPQPLLPSSVSSCSSSSSTDSFCADGFAVSQSPKQLNGGSKMTQRAGGVGSNGHARFNNGTVSRAHHHEQNYKSVGCLKTKKKKNK